MSTITHWLDLFYSDSISLALSFGMVAIIGWLSWIGKGRKVILSLTLVLYARYMLWRGLYTLNTEDSASTIVSWVVYSAEAYGLLQFIFFLYQAWAPQDRTCTQTRHRPTVDIFITVVNEPIEILKRTVVGCLKQEYPRDRFNVYILDDGQRDEIKDLAQAVGCHYLRRENRAHAKAGNLNHALQHSSGELIAVFDVDHVPVGKFLRETVGCFQDPKVAFVQTPHHFYNPDIFQRNLQLESRLKNEQALFFRTLQAGRDRHNSAFFAGSGGLFRRSQLLEIGGFQTQTITEDLHTSVLLHARGYKSCYLNKVLSAGLMPETFQGYLKQRTRWAIGSLQMMFRDNPLTIRGLTIAQRFDYLGSVFYFFLGPPRIICLVAPLFALVLNLSPLRADTSLLINFFFSYYVASAMAMRTISRGMRNAFWSDVYEVAMCFALSHALFKTLMTPFRKHAFEITPKGQKIEKTGIESRLSVGPHLIVYGALIFGIALGLMAWNGPVRPTGLAVNIFWAFVNLILLTVAILSANERPQWRNLLRLNRRLLCDISVGETCVSVRTRDITEHGLSVHLKQPILSSSEAVTVTLHGSKGAELTMKGHIVRQEAAAPRGVEMGIEFADVDEQTSQGLIQELFSHNSWQDAAKHAPGVFQSLWSFVSSVRVLFSRMRLRRRRMPRTVAQKNCVLSWQGLQLICLMREVSMNGLSVMVPGAHALNHDQGVLCLQGIVLKVSPVGVLQKGTKTVIRFTIYEIIKGKAEWIEINRASWPHIVEKERIVRSARKIRRVGSFFILTIMIVAFALVLVHRHAGIQLSLLN
jgi:cellulose synthase (UDP-forming)